MIWYRPLRLYGTYIVFCLISVSSGSAQTRSAKSETEPPVTYGAISGHVSFAGNNAPVRFASVALQPIESKNSGKASTPSFTVYETDLAGDFHIDHVPSGSYYVVVKHPGSLSPFASFTQAELEHPSPEIAQKIAAAIPAVSLRPGQPATINLALHTGASISGVVRFDDGTPYADAFVQLKRHGSDGKWTAPNAVDAYVHADHEGHWDFAGLPPGEYRVEVALQLEDRKQSSLLGENSSMWSNTKLSVPVYLGDTSREQDAKVITMDEGQQVTGQDITIPVSKMHTVTGAVVDHRTGQALNAGKVNLAFADGGKQLCSADIDPETRSFSIPFVLEGNYKLSVENAREARIEITPYPEGSFGSPQRKETLVRAYAPGNMPLVVQSDVSGVNLPVDPAGNKVK